MNDKQNNLLIVLAADNNYAVPLGITISSILANSKNPVGVELVVLDNKISDFRKKQISKIVNDYGAAMSFYDVSTFLDNYKLPEIRHLKKATYSRLFIPQILDCKKILYLDTDIIIKTDLLDLWRIDISNYLFAAAPEPEKDKILAEKNDARLSNYFNAGVMLINIPLWRENKITEKAIDFINSYPEKIEYADQDALNYVCHGKWFQLDNKFNYEITYNEPSNPKEAALIHYIGSTKPWHYRYPNNYREYRKYANLSPWKDEWKEPFTFKDFFEREEIKFKIFLKRIPFFKKVVRIILNRPQ